MASAYSLACLTVFASGPDCPRIRGWNRSYAAHRQVFEIGRCFGMLGGGRFRFDFVVAIA